MTLRVLSYNIKYGGTGRSAQLAAVIRAARPDVVMLQEATESHIVRAIAQAVEMPHRASRDGYSTGVISRHPIAHHEWHHPRGVKHAFLEVALEGIEWRLVGLHLSAWFSKWSERRRTREIGMLLEGIREHEHGPHVVCGDFNALAPGERLEAWRFPRWIQAMIWVSGRDIARSTIEAMHAAGYEDGFRRMHPGDTGWTFPVWDPQVRLDYAFVPREHAERIARCEVVREPAEVKAASDHLPLLVELE